MSDSLDRVLSGEVAPGIYRFASRRTAAAVCAQVESLGWRCFHLDGRRVNDKAEFLRESAVAMTFPSYFGHNWDAYEESITDLAWAPAPGYVLLYDHVRWFAVHQPRDWAVALDILAGAVDYWAQRGIPMIVLLRHAGRALLHLPRL
jgi:hypothetical protein